MGTDAGVKPGILVVGTGRMGSALARTFLKHEYTTGVWNRTRSKLEPLAALGARIADTLPAAIAAADIVVINVNDYETTEKLLGAEGVAGPAQHAPYRLRADLLQLGDLLIRAPFDVMQLDHGAVGDG